MRLRTAVGIGIALLIVAIPACSSGESDDASDSSTTSNPTTTIEDQGRATPEPTDAPLDGLAPDDGGFCDLMLTATTTFEVQPTTAAETEDAVGSITGLLRSLAAVDGVDAASAEALTTTADAIQAEAEQVGFEPEALAGSDFVQILQEPEFTSTMRGFAERAARECASETPASTVPG